MRQKVFSGLAFVVGAVTAFQASALQLYFLTSAILGGITGYLLRQNGFRRAIGIRPIPSKESNEVYGKVVKGELKLSDIKTTDGKIRYQPPTRQVKPITRRAATTLAGINIKADAPIPAHLRVEAPKIDSQRPDRDTDFEEGAAGKPLKEKLDYYRRNYRLSFVWRRLTNSMEAMARRQGYGGPKLSPEQEKKKRMAEQYEFERKRRLENRK